MLSVSSINVADEVLLLLSCHINLAGVNFGPRRYADETCLACLAP